MQMQSGSEMVVLLKNHHWDNAGSNRIVGQECDEIGPTNEEKVSLGKSKMDRSQLVAFYEMENQIK
jgi:hypothetical protein